MRSGLRFLIVGAVLGWAVARGYAEGPASRPTRSHPSWEEVTAGIVGLRSDASKRRDDGRGWELSFPPTATATTTWPAGGAFEPIASGRVEGAYERAYREVEGEVSRRSAMSARWLEWMRLSAAACRSDVPLKRYVLLRAFLLARVCREPIETLDGIAREIEPTLADGTAAALAQRAEVRAALADEMEYQFQRRDRAEDARRYEEAVAAYADVLEYQAEHAVFDQLQATLRGVRRYVRSCESATIRARYYAAREKVEQALERAFGGTGEGRRAGRRVAVILDASGSMLNAAPGPEVVRTLQALAESDWFLLVEMTEGGPEPFAEVWLPARGEFLDQARSFIGRYSPRGSGEMLPALALADDLKAERIRLISDGDVPDAALVRVFLQCRRTGAPVDAVISKTAGAQGIALMKEIARETKGTARPTEDPDAGALK